MEAISSSANSVRLLPLGISDFGLVVKQGCYYVDKTMYIPRLEMASNYLFLVRPRRFGKSLLLSMLKCYYDFNEKDRFDEYFGRLWIGSHPTPYCNRYAVLHLDFSQVTGTIDELKANFVSLLYYYGMLTITGNNGLMLRLGIPNNNVRKQYYGYLLEEYDRIRPADHWRIDEGYQAAALTGDWQPLVKTISDEYEKTCAVRCLIEGERLRVGEQSSGMRNLQGFFTAYLNMTNYYLTAPELELSHGYCDFFLLPDLGRYPMVAHSYILELKYLKQDATAEEAETQWAEAVSQITRYARDEKVRLLCSTTQLHLVVAQYRGYQLVKLEEVNRCNF